MLIFKVSKCSYNRVQLSSIEFHLLKVTYKALSKYERGKSAKKHEKFLVSKVEFNYKVSSGKKTLPLIQFSKIGLLLSKRFEVVGSKICISLTVATNLHTKSSRNEVPWIRIDFTGYSRFSI